MDIKLDLHIPNRNAEKRVTRHKDTVKEMLYEVRYLKSSEGMILALAG